LSPSRRRTLAPAALFLAAHYADLFLRHSRAANEVLRVPADVTAKPICLGRRMPR
jgi:hypothetical protein